MRYLRYPDLNTNSRWKDSISLVTKSGRTWKCAWGRLIARSATSRLGLENWLKHWGRQHSRSHQKDGRTTSTKTAPRSRGSSQILHAGNLRALRTTFMLGIQENSWGLSQAGHWTDNLVKAICPASLWPGGYPLEFSFVYVQFRASW